MIQAIQLRLPQPTDGINIFRLVAQCSPLDPNSVYCNLLQSTHFAKTSVVAVYEGSLVGFVSGYLIPERKDTLFVWQVAVAEQARGQGLAIRMLEHILKRDHCNKVVFLETTITESNQHSWRLFKKLAAVLETELVESLMFEREAHFAGEHDSEILVRIGPFKLT